MKKVAIFAVCDYISQPNGGEVYLLNNYLSAENNENLKIYLVGMTFNPEHQEGVWYKININNKVYDFLPVAKVVKDKEKTKIPFRLRMVLGIFKYRKTIADLNLDVKYIHSAELGIPFWRDKQSGLVYHVHGDPSITLGYSRFAFFRAKIFTDMYLTFTNKTIKKCKSVIWAAERPKDLYLKAQPEMKEEVDKKSYIVHSSFDTNLVAKNDVLESLPNRPHLITVARLAAIKRIDFIIESVSKLIAEGIDVDLIICGDGEERQSLQNLADTLGITDRVYFLGVTNREQTASALAQSDVFLFASENEAMSLVVLESLYMGTPVVSTDVGDVKVAVINGETGYIVDGYDLTEYCDCIKKILINGKENYMENCKVVAMNFTPDRMAENIDNILLK